MREQVEAALEEVALGLRMDGGDIELVDIDEDNVVHVRMKGACHGCPRAQMTLKMYVEQWLMERVPEVTGVEQVAEVMA